MPDHPLEDDERDPESLSILYEDEDMDESMDLGEEEIGDEPRTILITGASGNIGRKLRTAWEDVYDLVMIDVAADPADPEVVAADLSKFDEEWMGLFHGVNTVIHLAATPDERRLGGSGRAEHGCRLQRLSRGGPGRGGANHLRQLEPRHERLSRPG